MPSPITSAPSTFSSGSSLIAAPFVGPRNLRSILCACRSRNVQAIARGSSVSIERKSAIIAPIEWAARDRAEELDQRLDVAVPAQNTPADVVFEVEAAGGEIAADEGARLV